MRVRLFKRGIVTILILKNSIFFSFLCFRYTMLQYGKPGGQADFECQTLSNYLDTTVTILLLYEAQAMFLVSIELKIPRLKQTRNRQKPEIVYLHL